MTINRNNAGGEDALAIAKRLACYGYPVGFFPPGSKRPRNGGVKRFTTNPAALERWRARYGERCNVAVTPRNGEMIVDVDLYKLDGEARTQAEAAVRAFIGRIGCTAQRSARGGLHLVARDIPSFGSADVVALFGCPGEVKRPMAGYVMAVGSTFGAGTYTELPGHEWDGRAAPALFDAPVLLPAKGGARSGATREAPPQQPTPADLKELLDHVGDADADIYHEWIRVGMALHDMCAGSDLGLRAWDWWSRRSSKWAESVCAAKWRTFTSEGKDRVVGEGTLRFKARAGGYGSATPAEDFGPPQGDCAMYGEFIQAARPLPMLVRDFMHAGALGVLVGPTGAGKSTLATAESIAIAHPATTEFLGRAVERHGAALYVAAEAVETVRIGLRAYGEWVGINPTTLPIAVKQSAVPLDSEQAVRTLTNEVLALLSNHSISEPLRLVIVDTLACSLGDAEENDSTALRGVLANLSLLQRLLVAPKPGEIPPTVQVVAHPPHGAKRIKGSSSISPAIDFEHWLEAQAVAAYLEQRTADLRAPLPEGLDDILDMPMPVGTPRGLFINKLRGHGATHGLRIQFEQHRQEDWLRREDGTYATVARLGNQPVVEIPPATVPLPPRATHGVPTTTGRERQAERAEQANIKINERRQTELLREIRDKGEGFNLRIFVSDRGFGNEDNFRKKVVTVCRDKGWIEVGRGKVPVYKVTRRGATHLRSTGEDVA